MFKITETRGALGKEITLRKKNKKDDSTPVAEFSIAGVELGLEQVTALVATHTDERMFADVGFVSRDALSELRYFKPMKLKREILDCTVGVRLGSSDRAVKFPGADIKAITIDFGDRHAPAGTAILSFKVWAVPNEKEIDWLRLWSDEDVYVEIIAPEHTRERSDGLFPLQDD